MEITSKNFIKIQERTQFTVLEKETWLGPSAFGQIAQFHYAIWVLRFATSLASQFPHCSKHQSNSAHETKHDKENCLGQWEDQTEHKSRTDMLTSNSGHR